NYASRRAARQLQIAANNGAVAGLAVGQQAAQVAPMTGMRGMEGVARRQQLADLASLSAEAAAYGMSLEQYVRLRKRVGPPPFARPSYDAHSNTDSLMEGIYGR
ncbi:MAG: hypothetical protein EBZ75_13480, partial [Oxalobacteraceae bacterium]|nr:hypothetical protein [Oxalobacteraceae bacterium]